MVLRQDVGAIPATIWAEQLARPRCLEILTGWRWRTTTEIRQCNRNVRPPGPGRGRLLTNLRARCHTIPAAREARHSAEWSVGRHLRPWLKRLGRRFWRVEVPHRS